LKTSTADRALEAYLSDARARVDTVLERWGAAASPVIRYSLLSAGKRLRPTLVFAAYEAVGGAAPAIAELAAAVEVVHAYSLVHDDLPCMDNDDLRRGRPTTHRAFDVPAATLAGYQMVALAAQVLAAGLAAFDLEPERRRAIALELFRAAGAGGMIGGQALDLEAEGRGLEMAALEDVHRR
jgi:geranylgeranyl pyrophosphate synthase